jgi:hypothetical protein
MTDFKSLLQVLHDAKVEFVVVGAYAAVLQGHAAVTQDLDVCYDRSPANLKRLAAALHPYHPRLRGAPAGLPFSLDLRTLQAGMNFTLTTDLGDVDLLGELAGVGQFANVSKGAETISIFRVPCRVMNLTKLIESKRAAGRPKDLAILPGLEALKELKEQQAKTKSQRSSGPASKK